MARVFGYTLSLLLMAYMHQGGHPPLFSCCLLPSCYSLTQACFFFFMDLNICLYCEKPLAEENASFCSVACQAHEASKTCSFVILDRAVAHPLHDASCHPFHASSTSLYGHQKQSAYSHLSQTSMTTASSSSSSSSPSTFFEPSYYRRRSFYSTKSFTPKMPAPSMTDSLSSEISSASSSTFFASYPYGEDSVTSANVQRYNLQPTCIKNNISHPPSDLGRVHTLL
ncbi:hypothetical protein BX666DRAFT_1159701 [Dichotomocladium elegans]|nr:hypothetical protein BX666DRAFT_1159701 [Dichotomocladium elegans]